MTTPHTVFTLEQSQLWLAEQRRLGDAHRAKLKALESAPPSPLSPIVYRDADEACNARLNFEVQPDEEKSLSDTYENLFNEQELEREILALVETFPQMERNEREHFTRKIFGHDERVKPSLPGVLDSYFHIAGTIELCRDRIAAIEQELPRLKRRAKIYLNHKNSFKPWSWARINRERNKRLDRDAIANGQLPLQRGVSAGMGRVVMVDGVGK